MLQRRYSEPVWRIDVYDLFGLPEEVLRFWLSDTDSLAQSLDGAYEVIT